MMRIGIIGCGWLGRPLAKRLLERGHEVVGTTTRTEKVNALREDGIMAHVLDLNRDVSEDCARALGDCRRLFVNVPPGRGHADVETRYPAWMRRLLAVDSPAVERWVFASTTGVYGAARGPVLETTPPLPERATGRAVLAAERLLQAELGERCRVARLAGLAGGAREPGRWLAGKIGLPKGDAPVNLIHRVDAVARVVRLVEADDLAHSHYQLCAAVHPRKRDFYPERAERLGLVPPTFLPGGGLDKRIDATRIQHEFDYQWRYPDPRSFPVEGA